MRRQKTDDRREKTAIQEGRAYWNGHWSLVSEVSKVNMLSELRSLKASIPGLQANSNAVYDCRHYDAIAAGTAHLKKPSVGPKGLIGPPCHGER